VSLATGLGKTVLIATLPQLLKLRPNDVTLVIAHRDELIQQTVEKMRDANPDALIGVEKASSRASEECSIVVATVQTLANKRLKEFIARFGRRIALFVIDEAHHAAAPTYRAIVDAINEARPDAMVLGFTATPNRGDGVRLVDIFHDIVYTVDSRTAIDAGYLVPVRSFAVATKTDLDAASPLQRRRISTASPHAAATSYSARLQQPSTPKTAINSSSMPIASIRRTSRR